MSHLSEAELREMQQLLDKSRQRGSRRFIALARTPSSNDQQPLPPTSTQEIDGNTITVRTCRSPLELRCHLADPDADPLSTILLAAFDDQELSTDLRTRLQRSRLQNPDPWRTLLGLFDARETDPRLVKEQWLVDDLLTLPSEAFPKLGAQFLSKDLAHETLWRATLGFSRAQADGLAFLQWAVDGELRPKWLALSPERRQKFLQWTEPFSGKTLSIVLAVLIGVDETSVLALGLIARLLATQPVPKQRDQYHDLKARLETRYLKERKLKESHWLNWAETTEAYVLTELNSDERHRVARQAEALFEDGLELLAIASPVLGCGMVARRNQVESALGQALRACDSGKPTKRTLTPMRNAIEHLRRHADGGQEADQWLDAARALAWLIEAPQPSSSDSGDFGAQVRFASDQLSWLDDVRDRIDLSLAELKSSATLGKLQDRLMDQREALNESFAQAALEWFAQGGSLASPHVLLEDVLERIVAPLAEAAPVLLVVLDGMSTAVHRALQEDLQAEWQQLGPEGEELVAVTPLPTLTRICRTSLLTGELRDGTQQTEARLFPEHRALRLSAKGVPKLFHKKDVGAETLGETVEGAVRKTSNRVVAVVVNAIDDALANADQGTSSRTNIPVLTQLLAGALDAGRTVILASDHGHVIERSSKKVAAGSGDGARCRCVPSGETLHEGELRFSGTRVLGDEWVLPWSERVRYADRKRGYHGGVSPQEMVAPLSIWRPHEEASTSHQERLPEGWSALDPSPPSWWRLEPGTGRLQAQKVHTVGKRSARAAKSGASPQLGLLDDAVAKPRSLDQLPLSATFQEQMRRHARQNVRPEQIVELLAALSDAGGSLPSHALAIKLGKTSTRLRGLIAGAQKILNLEGYNVLFVDTDGVRFDSGLLEEQFELKSSSN